MTHKLEYNTVKLTLKQSVTGRKSWPVYRPNMNKGNNEMVRTALNVAVAVSLIVWSTVIFDYGYLGFLLVIGILGLFVAGAIKDEERHGL